MVYGDAPSAATPKTHVLTYEGRSFGEAGEGAGQFKLPRFIAAAPNGNVVVSDFVNQRLQLVSGTGKAVGAALPEMRGTAPGQVVGPSGVACDGSHLFLCEGGNHRVQKILLADGTPISRASSHGRGDGHLWCPMGIAVAKRFTASETETSKSDVFVADNINGRVAVYAASDLEFLRSFGERGSEPGQLLYPTGIAVKDEEVFVSETGNHRISVFSKKGDFQRCFGSGPGIGLGQLNEPRGLTFVKGWLLVVESKRCTVFSPQGVPHHLVELPHVGQLWGCCFDAEASTAYVTDIRAGNPKIFVLHAHGMSFDDGMTENERAAKKAMLKKAAEEEKMREYREGKGGK